MDAIRKHAITLMIVLALAVPAYWLLTAAAGPSSGKSLDRFAQGELSALSTLEAGSRPEVGFRDAGGDPVTPASFTDDLVLVNFWATWCAPCEAEMPSLAALQRARGQDGELEVVAVSVDGEEDAEWAREELHRLSGGALDFYHAPADTEGEVLGAYGLIGFPTTILYKDGVEVARLSGEADWAGLEAMSLLNAAGEGG